MAMHGAAHPQRLGKYQVTGVLGEGAMGVVYRGFDPGIHRPVALKTVLRQLLAAGDAASASFATRFRNEAQAAGRLSHPGIVSIYEYGEDGGTAFIAMEFVEGRTLAQLLSAAPLLPEADVLRLMAQLLDALECAHQAGVWHRDIKPANLVVTQQGRLKVMDFGIARIDRGGLTQTTSLAGTPGYIAPEQYSGVELDHRVDLFAAGVLLYRLLAGRAPFGGTPEAVMYQIFNEDPPPPSRVAAGTRTARYDAVVAKALAKDRDARFASAAEFLRALQQAAGTEASDVALTVAAAPAPPDSTFARTLPGTSAPATAPPSTGGTLLTASTIAGWDAAALAPIELALARLLGPMARLLVRQAACVCTDVASLCARVAEHITDPRERAAFLSRVAALRTQPPAAGAAPAPAPSNATLQPELVVHALRVLTGQIGPIARIVVKEAAAQAASRDEFFALLAEQMPAGAQRERLLRRLRRRAA